MSQCPCSAKVLALKLYTSKEGATDKYVCECGVVRKHGTNEGYSSLVLHIHKQHADQVLLKEWDPQITTQGPSFYSKKTVHIFSWLEMVIGGLFPFSFCKKKLIRKNFRVAGISVENYYEIHGYIYGKSEAQSGTRSTFKFDIAFNGLSSIYTHFVCVFAQLPSKNSCGQGRALLGFSPFQDEFLMDAPSHVVIL